MKNIFTLLGSVAAVAIIVIASNTASAAIEPARPLILIPTTLGTLPSEDGPVLDPIFGIYDNFIETFVDNGYVLGSTLFVLEYDWQESLTETSADLADLVSDIGVPVDIVGHGQGGLIAWHYHDNGGAANIENLVLLGTPVGGVPASYLTWEGGEFRLHGLLVGHGLGQALLDAQAQSAGAASTFAYVQDNAPAFLDLLPTFDTIQYLIDGTQPGNPFMDALWLGGLEPVSGGEGYISIRGAVANDDVGTITSITVQPSTNPPLWPDGEPVPPINTILTGGDRIVPQEWATFFDAEGANMVISANHHELPTEAQSDIFTFLNGVEPESLANETVSISCLLFVSTSAGTDMTITGPGGEVLGDGVNDFERAFYSGAGYETEYGVIANPGTDLYSIQVAGAANSSFTLDALEICDGITRSGSTAETIPEDGIIDLEVEISEEGVDVTVAPDAPSDTGAPVVTITSPVEGETYLTTDEVLASSTVTDPEGSPIATVEYLFNTNAIDHTQPLPLSSAPLGAATVKVVATDTAGNVGSSTVSFFIGEGAPSDTGTPVVTITSPLAGSTHFSDATVHATADITDPEGSSIVETVYSFNDEVINPADPLPLFDAPLGAAIVSVEATDSAGNTGSSSVSFTIAEPPPEPDTYTIEFLPPISPKCYLHSKKHGISNLWKRVFDRLHIHSKFKDYLKRHIDCRDISIFKAGSNVPVKFRVKDEDDQYVQLDNTVVWIEPVKGPSLDSPIEEAEYTEQPSTGYFYAWKGSHYQYNWKTSRSQRGYWYNLFVVLPDGSIHQTIVGLR